MLSERCRNTSSFSAPFLRLPLPAEDFKVVLATFNPLETDNEKTGFDDGFSALGLQ